MRIKDIVGLRGGGWLLCLLLLAACSDSGNTTKQAEQVADGYYQALKNKDFDKAVSYFMDTTAEPRVQWLDEIHDYHNKLGDLQSFKLVGQQVNTVYSGTRYTLHYKTQYSKFAATETLILFDGVSTFGGGNGGNVLLIEGMIIRSKGL